MLVIHAIAPAIKGTYIFSSLVLFLDLFTLNVDYLIYFVANLNTLTKVDSGY